MPKPKIIQPQRKVRRVLKKFVTEEGTRDMTGVIVHHSKKQMLDLASKYSQEYRFHEKPKYGSAVKYPTQQGPNRSVWAYDSHVGRRGGWIEKIQGFGRIPSKLPEKIKDAAFARDYQRNAELARHKIPEQLFAEPTMKKAETKLQKLLTTEFKGSSTRGMGAIIEPTDVKGTVIRYEHVGRLLSQLSKPNMFEWKEAMAHTPHFNTPQEESKKSPREIAESFLHNSGERTNWWGLADYNCAVYFAPESFKPDSVDRRYWGTIQPKAEVIGIQLFDPNPNTLIDLSKAMAKRRPQDPIPILDLYGNIFYPTKNPKKK